MAASKKQATTKATSKANGPRYHKPSSPEGRRTIIIASTGALAVFVLLIAGAAALKKRLKARPAGAPASDPQADVVDKAVAGVLTAALVLAGAWVVVRQLIWLRHKSADFVKAMREEQERQAEARQLRAEQRAAKKARLAHRGASDKTSHSAILADDLLHSMRSTAAATFHWLRGRHLPSSPAEPPAEAAPIRSRGPARARGDRGKPVKQRWTVARAEATAAAATTDADYDEDFSAFEMILNSPAATDAGSEPAAEDEDAEKEDGSEEEEAAADEDVERVPLDLSPHAEGTRVALDNLTASSTVASVQPAELHVALQCTSCDKNFVASVGLSALNAASAEARVWCERCSALFSAQLRPTLVAPAAASGPCPLGHLDLSGCSVVDVLPQSSLLATCINCDAETPLAPFARNRRVESACRGCHCKLAFCARQIQLQVLTAARPVAGQSRRRKEGGGGLEEELRAFKANFAKAHGAPPSFTVGTPLPGRGSCKHFKRSFRWLRFDCCQRALPCPVCHEDSGCPAAELGVRANHMICGLCSREQPFTQGSCECGASFTVAFSSHWQGGHGCRDKTKLSKKDSRKHQGSSLKTVSAKASRVGPKSKRSS